MKKLTPIRAIRKKCLDCCNGSSQEVKLCNLKTCPLYPYKTGHKPKEGTEEYNLITNGSLSLRPPQNPIVERKESI